jgi:ABC-type glycerol-3-phosphate transport system substrate-binding protein
MEESITITFAYRRPDEEQVRALVEEFCGRHPHITVVPRPVSVGALQDELEAGHVDVIEAWQSWLNEKQEQGDLLALDPFINVDESLEASDSYPATLESLSIAGRTWAIPYGVNSTVMYYNQVDTARRDQSRRADSSGSDGLGAARGRNQP